MIDLQTAIALEDLTCRHCGVRASGVIRYSDGTFMLDFHGRLLRVALLDARTEGFKDALPFVLETFRYLEQRCSVVAL